MGLQLIDVVLQLDEIELQPRGSARIERLRQLQNPDLNRVLELALSPFHTFGITAETMPKPDPEGLITEWMPTLEDFLDLCDRLAARDLSGNDAKEAIQIFLAHCQPMEQVWCARVIAKDLRLDMDVSSVNKAIPGLILKESLALADKLIDVDEDDLKGTWAVQIKHDGMRCKATFPAGGGEVRLTSRNGLPLVNYEPVREALTALNKTIPSAYVRYLDGEVVSIVDGKVDFQAAQSTIHATKSGKVVGELKYLVFDGAAENEWKNPSLPYADRYWAVDEVLSTVPSRHYEMVQTDLIIRDPTIEQLQGLLQGYLDDGHEGFMIRQLDESVVMKRSSRLVKVKKEEDDEFVVVGTFPGKGKRAKYVGGLLVQLKDGREQPVGSGLKDKDLEAITKDPGAYIGRKATVRFMEYTKDGLLRQPRIKGFRADEDMPS